MGQRRQPKHSSEPRQAVDFHDIRQLEAIRSPIRQEIMDTLSRSAPMSVPELAAELGVSPESLYFHIRALQGVGLVRQCGQRSTTKRPAALYETVSRQNRRIDYDLDDPEKLPIYQDIARSVMRLSAGDATAALESGHVTATGIHRNYWIGRLTGWLDEDELAEVNAHFQALVRLFRRTRPGSGKQLLAWSWGLSPLIRRCGAFTEETD